MQELHDFSGFGLRVNAREDGTLEAAYLQLSDGKVARTEEKIPSVLLMDFDANNLVVGIEILAPVKLTAVLEMANRLEEAHRSAFNAFVKSYAPPAILEPA